MCGAPSEKPLVFPCKTFPTSIGSLLLNFKGLPYQTIFVPFQDIESTARSLGASPTNTRSPQYTVPILVDESPQGERTVVSGTDQIRDYIDAKVPSPAFAYTAKGEEERWIQLVERALFKALPPLNAPAQARFLDPPAREFYMWTRKEWYGTPHLPCFPPSLVLTLRSGLDLEPLIQNPNHGALWPGVDAAFDEFARVIDTLPPSESWLFGRDAPAYADFVLCAGLCWTKAIGPDGAWDRIRVRNGGRWGRLYESCEKYMPKDLH